MTLLSSASHLFFESDLVLPNTNWQVHINQFCLYGIASWLEDEFGIAPRQIEAVARSHAAIWSLVGGSALPIDATSRLVLIPSAAIDLSELRVPQEWVDIPDWVGDYYVGVQVNPNSGQLRVWGYTTQAELKQQGYYDAADRSYCLHGEAVTDLAILSTARALGVLKPARLSLPALPSVPAAQVESLVQRLSHPDCRIPRLAVPFALWAALIADAEVRSRLVRQGPQNLSQWLSGLTQAESTTWLTAGWQSVESLLSSAPAGLAWRASDPANTVRNGKRLMLVTGTETSVVVLVVAVESEADERVSIRVQLRPDANASLPDNIELSLIAPTGEVTQTVSRQPTDDYIQLKRFRLPPGYRFTIQVRSGIATVQELFVS